VPAYTTHARTRGGRGSCVLGWRTMLRHRGGPPTALQDGASVAVARSRGGELDHLGVWDGRGEQLAGRERPTEHPTIVRGKSLICVLMAR